MYVWHLGIPCKNAITLLKFNLCFEYPCLHIFACLAYDSQLVSTHTDTCQAWQVLGSMSMPCRTFNNTGSQFRQTNLHTLSDTHTHAIKLDELSCRIKCFIDAHIMQNTKRQQLDKQSQNINISWQLQLFRLNCDALFPFFFLLYCRRRKPGNKTGQFSARKGAQTKEKEEENSMKGVGNALSFPFRQRRQFWPTLKANEMMTKSLTAGEGTKSH